MTIIYFDEQNSERRLNIPFHPKEITFDKFCDFRTARSVFEDDELEPEEYAAQLTAGLQHLVPGLRTAGLPFALKEDWDRDLIDEHYRIQLNDELSILRIYAHLVTTINGYQVESIPESFTFKHKGKDFEINKTRVAAAMLNKTTGEMIETLEYQRRASILMEDRRRDFGNIDFELGLTELAILVRQPGEELPSDKPTRDRFIEQRRNIFKTVTLDTIIEMRFFFLKSLVESETIRTTAIFGRVHRMQARHTTKVSTFWKWRRQGRLHPNS